MQAVVLRIQKQVSLPPSPDPIHRAPVTTRGPPASTRGRCRLVHPSGGLGRYTQHVPKFLATNRRHDAMTRVDLDDSASGPFPAGLGHGHIHGGLTSVLPPGRSERDGDRRHGRQRPRLSCLVPPVLHMHRQRRHLQLVHLPHRAGGRRPRHRHRRLAEPPRPRHQLTITRKPPTPRPRAAARDCPQKLFLSSYLTF